MFFIDAIERSHDVDEPEVRARFRESAPIDVDLLKSECIRVELLQQLFQAIRDQPDAKRDRPSIPKDYTRALALELDLRRLEKSNPTERPVRIRIEVPHLLPLIQPFMRGSLARNGKVDLERIVFSLPLRLTLFLTTHKALLRRCCA